LVNERTGKILICDFGMAQFLPMPDQTPAISLQNEKLFASSELSARLSSTIDTMCSVPYAAPEVIQSGKQMVAVEVDIWAVGVIMHALFTGELPFRHSFQPRLQMMIARGDWDREALHERCGDAVFEVVDHCLKFHPEHRWPTRRILESDFFQDMPMI